MTSRPPRSGFTLIETLVVLMIVAIVCALLAVAVSTARETARRAQCASNLRQIGIALNAYVAEIHCFPQGIHGNGFSVHTMLLPYLDQRPLFDAINFDLGPYQGIREGGGNKTAALTQLAVFLCPADSSQWALGAPASYPGNRGRGKQAFGLDGAFGFEMDGPVQMADFRDGTASTVAFSEWALGAVVSQKRDGRRTTFATSEALTGPSELEAFAKMCHGLDIQKAQLYRLGKGSTWQRGDLSFTLYNHIMKPNDHSCTNGPLIQEGAWTAGSWHSNGVHCLFADGHARLVHDTVDLPVWRAIASRAGQETVGLDD